ncbi:MAG: hypothetical protein ABJD74_15280, partial [Roseibium sp.]
HVSMIKNCLALHSGASQCLVKLVAISHSMCTIKVQWRFGFSEGNVDSGVLAGGMLNEHGCFLRRNDFLALIVRRLAQALLFRGCMIA